MSGLPPRSGIAAKSSAQSAGNPASDGGSCPRDLCVAVWSPNMPFTSEACQVHAGGLGDTNNGGAGLQPLWVMSDRFGRHELWRRWVAAALGNEGQVDKTQTMAALGCSRFGGQVVMAVVVSFSLVSSLILVVVAVALVLVAARVARCLWGESARPPCWKHRAHRGFLCTLS